MTELANYLEIPLTASFVRDIAVWRDTEALDKKAGIFVYAGTELALGALMVAEVVELVARFVFLLLASPLYLIGPSARANYAKFASGFVGTGLTALFTAHALYHNLFSYHVAANSFLSCAQLLGKLSAEQAREACNETDKVYKDGAEEDIVELKEGLVKFKENVISDIILKDLPKYLGLAGIIESASLL